MKVDGGGGVSHKSDFACLCGWSFFLGNEKFCFVPIHCVVEKKEFSLSEKKFLFLFKLICFGKFLFPPKVKMREGIK